MNRLDRDLRALEAERNRLVTKPELEASVGSVAWTAVTGKPSTFSPSAHTHPASEISDSTSAGRSLLTAANSAAQTALLDAVTSGAKGLAPASGGGTANFLRADGTWAAPPSGAFALTDATDATVSGAAEGQVLVRGASEFQNLTVLTFALGPFFINDLPGSATTQATLGYFNTATALSRNGNDIRMDRAGRVVGLMVTSDAARTAGTATVRVRVAGSGTTFNSGAVALDATNTTSDSSFVAFGSGLAFTAGQTLGVDVVTSGWTPTTANLQISLVVMLTPF